MGRSRGIELVWPDKSPPKALEPAPGDLSIVERVEPSVIDSDGQASLPLDDSAWRNLLVRGDNLIAMSALADRLRGGIDLIYIDPPYATGLSYYTQTDVGDGDRSVARRAYRDQTTDGMIGYLEAMHARLSCMRELLRDEGKIFVHCDWRANSMLRLVLDELFGPECFRNEIIWRRAPNLGRQAASKQLGRVFDSILVYSKSPGAPFPGPVPRRRAEVAYDRKGKPKGARWDEERKLYFTTAPRGDYTDQSIAELRKQGRVYDSASGTVYIKYFLTRGEDGRWYKDQPVDALWDDFEVRPLRHRPKAEDMGYDTQKPEGLLERIIGWATRPGDLVADFFCGSGTTAAVAERMGRRWVAADRGGAAIEITRRRLLDLARDRAVAPFDVASVEAAERRRWAETRDDAEAVLRAYGAEPVEGRWGRSEQARVFVGPTERAISDDEILAAVAESAGTLVVLAFAWEGQDPATLRRAASERGVELEMRTIPMEVVRGSPGRGGLRFPTRPEIELEIGVEDDPGRMQLRLTGVRCDESGEMAWAERVDAWMVDFAGEEPFRPDWRSYRSQRDRSLDLETPACFLGRDCVRVRVITVFGDEATRTIRLA